VNSTIEKFQGELRRYEQAAQNGGEQNLPFDLKNGFNFIDEEPLVEELDSLVRVVALGNKRRLVTLGAEYAEPQFMNREDAGLHFMQYGYWYKDDHDKWKRIPALQKWMQSGLRKKDFTGVRFDPGLPPGGVEGGILNLWTGFAIEEKQGDWSLLRAHMLDNMVQGNEDYMNRLLVWIAHMFQKPGEKIGVGYLFRGEPGAGKTTLPEFLGHIVGDRHAIMADKSEQCTGKFNAGLELCLFLAAEEAFFAGDPTQKGPLKHLVTGHRLRYEPKGRDAYMGPNFTNMMMTSNERFALAAMLKERRWNVHDVGNAQRNNEEYFGPLRAQMFGGGMAAMLYDLKRHKFDGIALRDPPMTPALREIITLALDDADKWLQYALTEGQFPVRDENHRAPVKWSTEIEKAEIVASYNDFVPNRKRVPWTSQDVQFFLRSRLPIETSKMMVERYSLHEGNGGKKKDRVPSWRFPTLGDARAAYTKVTGHTFEEDDA